MRLTSWLACLCRGRRLARRNNRTLRSTRVSRSRSPRPTTAEVLEDRTLLSVTTLLIDGELSVVSDNGESVAIGADLFSNVEVTVDGVVDTNVGPFAASSVQSMVVEGDDLDNVLDLSGVLSADYTWTDIDGNPMTVDVRGGNGDDTLVGAGDLVSSLSGGDGDDTITVLGADGWVDAGDGNDLVVGGDGSDTLSGGDGNDTITGGLLDDRLEGGNGLDSLDGGVGNDTLLGGDGPDTLDGNVGDDSLNGASGTDSLIGNVGDDTIRGGGGNDIVYGDWTVAIDSPGDDSLYGQGGNDVIRGGGGVDSISGGTGHDLIHSMSDMGVTMDLPPEATHPPGTSEPAGNQPPTVNDDSAVTTQENRTLVNVLANDTDLDGGINIYSIEITNQPANGTAFVQANGLVLFTPFPGFSGLDTATYTVEDYFGRVSAEATLEVETVGLDPLGDTLSGSAGNDTIYGNFGEDKILGGSGDDQLFGLYNDDTMNGQAGDDTLCGGGGSDRMSGQTGDDLLQSICPGPGITPPEFFIDDPIGFTSSTVDVLMILDISGSTAGSFGGSPVGDVNGDGMADTVLDAEIAGFISLNDQLIADGVNANVGVIAFDSFSYQSDMDSVTAGVQLSTIPTADADGNGVMDVEDVLRGLQFQGGTAFEPPLQMAEVFFTSMGTSSGAGVLVFLSDGTPWDTGAFGDEVANLNGMGIDLRAFGVGSGAWLPDLQVIDPNATTFTTTDELVNKLGGLGITTSNEIPFIVNLTKWSSRDISIDYTTVDGTAKDGVDYTAVSGTLVFSPGQTQKSVIVEPISGAIINPGANFYLQLSNPYNAIINDGQGVATFEGGDPAGSVSSVAAYSPTADVTVIESNTTEFQHPELDIELILAQARRAETGDYVPAQLTVTFIDDVAPTWSVREQIVASLGGSILSQFDAMDQALVSLGNPSDAIIDDVVAWMNHAAVAAAQPVYYAAPPVIRTRDTQFSLAGDDSAVTRLFDVVVPGTIEIEMEWSGASDSLVASLYGPGDASSRLTPVRTATGSSSVEFSVDVSAATVEQGVGWRLVVTDPNGGADAAGEITITSPMDRDVESRFQMERVSLSSGSIWPSDALQAEFLADLEEASTSGLHGVITLTRAPSLADLQVLDSHCIDRQSYFGGNHAYGFVPRDVNLNDPALADLVAFVTPMFPDQKIDSDLLAGNYDRFEITTDELGEFNYVVDQQGDLKVTVHFGTDIPQYTVTSILGSFGNEFSAVSDSVWNVTIEETDLVTLATRDAVEWIGAGPAPSVVENDQTRATMQVDAVQAATVDPVAATITYSGLTGAGIQAAVHEGGVDASHPDLNVVVDIPAVSAHATHVAGIIAGTGQESASNGGTPFQWRGMAPGAELIDLGSGGMYSASSVLSAVQQDSMDVTNTSLAVSPDGNYTATNQLLDSLINGEATTGGVSVPRRPHMLSAGNGGANTQYGNQRGYFATTKQMKNTILVGNWNASANKLSTSSSMGPMYDGRIGPDVVAPGSGIQSTQNGGGYTGMGGTSMASPAVVGVHALMLEGWETTYSIPQGTTIDQDPPLPSTLRAVLIHTAVDIVDGDVRNSTHPEIDSDSDSTNGTDGLGRATATPGPDFSTGWGLVDALAATTLITDSRMGQNSPVPERILEAASAQADVNDYAFTVPQSFIDSGVPLRVTISWDDVGAAVQTPATSPRLVNDLDLELVGPDGTTYYPWQIGQDILDMSGNPISDVAQTPGTPIQVQLPVSPTTTPATQDDYIPADVLSGTGDWVARTGRDHLNNVEQVHVDNGNLVTGTWTARVVGFNVATGSQDYSLVSDVPLMTSFIVMEGTMDTVDTGDSMWGGSGSDTLVGNDGDDLLNGGSGRDLLQGENGNDQLRGGSNSDTLEGGQGDDTLDGQGAGDTLRAGSGNDVAVWQHGHGADQLDGGDGYDQVHGRGGDGAESFTLQENALDLVYNTTARLQITDGTSAINVGHTFSEVVMQPGEGDDTITLGDLPHVPSLLVRINGEGGNDVLTAAGTDPGVVRVLFDGGDGNDTITGSQLRDTIRGGDGDDELYGGDGDDSIQGGDGDDVIDGQDGDDLLLGENGFDTLEGNAGNDQLVGGEDRDLLQGGSGDDLLNGDAGRDTLNGKSGDDTLFGGEGTDRMYGGTGDDVLDGGRDDDSLYGNSGDDRLLGDHGNDSLKGGNGNDTMVGHDGDDQMFGERGDDQLGGGDGNDTLNGARGDDILLGGDGDDTLLAGSGADAVLGNLGDDYVKGQGGTRDTIAGGEGSDMVFGLASEIDEAFTVSSDLMSELDAV